VVPPFADAHNHDLGDTTQLEARVARHLRDGVFYKKNAGYVRELTLPVLDRIDRLDAMEVTYAHGALTVSGGHPVALYEGLLQRGVLPGWRKEHLDTRAFFVIDDEHDLENKWPLVLAGKPDFIKAYLEYSEEYETRRSDSSFYGHRGLDPRLLPVIVRKAHEAGLRVSVHVETATDFRHATVAGADEIAHLPGYEIPRGAATARYELSEADADLAARSGVVVVTTTGVSAGFHRGDAEQLERVRANQARNLRLLMRHGVRLAVGSDVWGDTSAGEVRSLIGLGVFSPLELLKLWCESTPQAIFPGRRIGRLAEGYEASFLVLDANPVVDFASVGRIVGRFKRGTPLHLLGE
jgi:cytosine/adenosine deaminase-related metal-dependent hydrolase